MLKISIWPVKKLEPIFLSVEIIDCHHIKNIDATINYFSVVNFMNASDVLAS
jgi:hypothetical protein